MKPEVIAENLLDIGAIHLRPDDPFTWASGIKSPIYCDNRKTLAYPQLRKQLATSLASLVKSKIPEVEVISATATAGIPHGAWVAQELNLPMSYVRSKAKAHGMGSAIEGAPAQGKQIALIEDLISTGGSSFDALSKLRNEGGNADHIFALFSYGTRRSTELFAANQVISTTLLDAETLIQVAIQKQVVTSSQAQEVLSFLKEL